MKTPFYPDQSYNIHFHDPGIEPWITGILKSVKFKSVLDVGAGLGFWGFLIRTYINPHSIIVGIDISRDKLLKLNLLRIYDGLICCDARHLPFRQKTIDLLISVEAIHRLPDLKKILMNYEKILTHQGYLVLAFPISYVVLKELLNLNFEIFGVFHSGFLISGGYMLLDIIRGKEITLPTRSITIRLSALLLRILYRILGLRIIHYCIAVKPFIKVKNNV